MNSLSEYAESLSDEIKWHGSHKENAGTIKLRAGNLSMLFEKGSLRYISCGKNEIIRMIYSAVRDRSWLTINPLIEDENIVTTGNSFRITFRCLYLSGEINFSAYYVIEGRQDNSITFTLEGEALGSFKKNRIGFCVLHPIEGCAGRSCVIEHSDGAIRRSNFPDMISSHQVFTGIRAIKWEFNGLNCRLDFEGDIFETEDQRNWTDASYKTYCTPLEHPFPVTMNKGERINQRIELKVDGDFQTEKPDDDTIKITISRDSSSAIPAIGIGRSTRSESLTGREIKILRKLKFDHYRIDLHLFDPGWKVKAELAACEAQKLGYPAELALFFDNNAQNQVHELIDWLSAIHLNITLMILYDKTAASTPDVLTDALAPLLKNAFPGVRIACGTNANFTQLNSNRPQSAIADYICYSIHPQEHASDNTTLVENLKAQEYTVENALSFFPGRGIWISPVNIQRRFNANIQNYETSHSGSGIPPQVDSRLMSLFGACWCAGSLKYLLESGIAGVTCFETVGERGIIQGDYPSGWPDKFPSVKGMIFPLFHVLRFLLVNKSFRIIKSRSTEPLNADLLLLANDTKLKALAINYTSEDQNISLDFCRDLLIVSQLDSDSFPDAVSNSGWHGEKINIPVGSSLLLKPFSVTFIEAGLQK